jgi:hypothetical protein
MSELALQSDMQFDVPRSVWDVSNTVDQRALMAFRLEPEFVCIAVPHALPWCMRVVSDFLNAAGRAVCTAPLLAEYVPLFFPLRRVVDARVSMAIDDSFHFVSFLELHSGVLELHSGLIVDQLWGTRTASRHSIAGPAALARHSGHQCGLPACIQACIGQLGACAELYSHIAVALVTA